MTLGVVCLLFFGFALLGVPLVWTLLLSTILTIVLLGKFYPLQAVFLTYIGGVEPIHLVAVPLFVVAGELVGRGGVGAKMIQLARCVLGFLPGGLGVVTVGASMLFGAVSGSAIAASAAIGTVSIPSMAERGYPRAFGAALVASAGTLGVIIPPSIPMLVYGFVGNVSIAELFIAGIVPGLLFGLALMAVCVWVGLRTGCDPGGAGPSLGELARTTVECGPALLMPAIVLGGIYGGIFTPTEAAAVAVLYGLVLALVVYRDLPLRALPGLILDAFITSAIVMVVLGATAALAWLITLEQVPAQLTALILAISGSRLVFLLLLNLALLVLGIFLEPLPALLLTAPLFIPTAQAFGVDPVHLGLIMTCNLAIGLYTPPVGGTLFVAARIGGVGMWAISKALVPLFLVSLVVLLLVTYVEWLPMVLVHAYRGS